MSRERDVSNLSSEEKESLPPYGGTPINTPEGTEGANEPEVKVPDSIITISEDFSQCRNILERRRRRWGVIEGWRSSFGPEAYGPTLTKDLNFLSDGEPVNYPFGYIAYSNQLIPCGVPVSIAPVTITTNISSITFTPDLPDGLSVEASTGVITGTPTVTLESTRFLVQTVTFSEDRFRTLFTMRVYDPVAIPDIEYPNSSVAASGVAFVLTPTTYVIPDGVVPTINPALGNNLTFTASTGVISGTPSGVMPRIRYNVRATGASPIDDLVFGDSFVLAVSSVGFPSAVYSFTTTSIPISVARTILPTTWANIGAATISPTLPTGLSFTSSNGAISGTPTVATQAKIYTINFSGTGLAAAVTDSTQVSFNVCSVTNSTPSGIHWEITPVETSAVDWPMSGWANYTATYKITDYTVNPPSSINLLCGGPVQKHPITYVLNRSTAYACNILLRNGSYPTFIIDKKNYWYAAYKTTGIRGVRLIAESIGGVKISHGNIKIYINSVSGTNGTTIPGAMRDISFSGIYFSGVSGLGNTALMIQPNVSAVVVPGLHFYDCTFDGKQMPSKWLIRDYNAIDHRFIRCTFKDNWKPQETTLAVEHGLYNSGDFGINFIEDCMFSGLGRNAVQCGNYKAYSTDQNQNSFCPRSTGGWVLNNVSAVQCGMASWTVPGGNPQYNKNSYGAVYYTFAGVSAVFMTSCVASGGYNRIDGYDFNKGTGALVVWKNPDTVNITKTTDPEFYGNKIVVLSGCTFDFKDLPEFDLVNIKNVRQLWVSGGVYKGPNKAIFQLSSHAVGAGAGNEEQGHNPNGLPYIASSFFNFPLTTATFPGGYPPYVKANCLPHSNCTIINQTVFEAWVNAADQPPPTRPAKPTDGTFLYQGGFTHPFTGVITA